jgi:hypothetical protein
MYHARGKNADVQLIRDAPAVRDEAMPDVTFPRVAGCKKARQFISADSDRANEATRWKVSSSVEFCRVAAS